MTSSCSHWIWYSGEAHIAATRRLRDVTSSLVPQSTNPSLVVLIGFRERPSFSKKPKRQPGQLCLDMDLSVSTQPLLLGTAALHQKSNARVTCCIPEKEESLSATASGTDAETMIFSQLLYPFVDVFCFCSYSLGDLQRIATRVASWMSRGQVHDSLLQHPALLIVLEGTHWHQLNADIDAYETFNTLVQEITSESLSSCFSKVEVLQLPTRTSYANLRRHLSDRAAAVRQSRYDAGVLFSVEHFNEFFERAWECGAANRPFDIIHGARQDLPVSTNLATHLIDFMDQVQLGKDLKDFVAPTIASSILLDHYFPEMHLFRPADVFHRLYEATCQKACEYATKSNREDDLFLPNMLNSLILSHLEILFKRLARGELATAIHKTTLARFQTIWQVIKSRKTCLSCLTQTPQHKNPCGHFICETCLQVYGSSDVKDEWLFSLKECVLCGVASGLTVRIRPPTAGQSILCLDGGGIRGIVSTTLLRLLEERLDLPIPIQEHFTHAYGISAGALNLLALFINGWSVERCAIEFEELAQLAFNPRPIPGFPLLNWLFSLIFGSLYSAKGIENALKRVFSDTRITDMCYANTIGTKVGIATSSILQPSNCLFTNYNGIGEERTSYTIPKDCDSVKAWEVARSSSAAPVFFSPKYLPGIGTLQDAGVLQSNPILVALSELTALGSDSTLDFILNVGCGSPPSLPSRDTRARPVKDSWPFRISRAYMYLIQGQKTWNDLVSIAKRVLGNRSLYRLDITLRNPPRLDDHQMMPILKSFVYSDRNAAKVVEEMARRLFANLFYFELDALPVRSGTKFSVRGRILCVRKGCDPAIPQILQRLFQSTLLINGRTVSSSPTTDVHQNIFQPVTFSTGESLRMEIRESGTRDLCPLSGSPYSIPKLVSSGELRAAFGTRTHKRRAVGEICNRPPRRRRLFGAEGLDIAPFI